MEGEIAKLIDAAERSEDVFFRYTGSHGSMPCSSDAISRQRV